jgi:hypothetical protein
MELVLEYALIIRIIEAGIRTGPVPAMVYPRAKQSRDPKNVYGLAVGII